MTVSAPREAIRQLLDNYFSSGTLVRGQVGFDHIIKDYGDSGTTCGYLVHWMLWRMGCTDATLINRYEPDSAFTYTDGDNINRVLRHYAFSSSRGGTTASVAEDLFGGGYTLDAGDIIIVKGRPLESGDSSEHIFLVVSTVFQTDSKIGLYIAQAGGGLNAKGQSGEEKYIEITRSDNREYVGTKQEDGPFAMVPSVVKGVGARPILGYLNIDLVEWDALPTCQGLDALTYRSDETTSLGLEKVIHHNYASMVGSIWRVQYGSDVYYYVLYKGHRVFYASAGTPTLYQGSGVWYAKSSGLELKWDASGVSESYMFKSGTPVNKLNGFSSEGRPCEAVKLEGKAYNHVLSSYKNGRGMPITP